MSTNFYQNKSFSISILEKEKPKVIFKKWCDFLIKNPGIYSLEGENQVGKSLLIKMIMGVLPPKSESNNVGTVNINDNEVTINNIIDARNNGIEAVFQDDELIPTMTIKQQIELKYIEKRKVLDYFKSFWNIIFSYFEGVLSAFRVEKNINSFLNKLKFSNEQLYPETILLEQTIEYFKLLGLEQSILNKYPSQLSGGTIARLKIAIAFLNKKLKILFLDEALNAIDKNSKFDIISIIKKKFKDSNTAIVIVSHNEKEIYHWQPKTRYFIESQDIKMDESYIYSGVEPYIKIPNNYITKIDSLQEGINYINNIFIRNGKNKFIILIDKQTKNNYFINQLLSSISISNDNVFEIEVKEKDKNLETYKTITTDILSKYPKANATFIIIGGGVLINLAQFICGTINRGLNKYIIVPTTVMSIADVAIGSKASLNISSSKHRVGLYSNPVAVISDKNFLKKLPLKQIKIGFSECLKHGILQDVNLYNEVKSLLKESKVDIDRTFNVAVKTRDLKGECLVKDPFEKNISRLLIFGHLHSHVVESLSNFDISHGIAVYLGILIDLKINGLDTVYSELKFILNDNDLKSDFQVFKNLIDNTDIDSLKQCYNSDVKQQHYISDSIFSILKIDRLGQYENIQISPTIKSLEITYDKIVPILKAIAGEIE